MSRNEELERFCNLIETTPEWWAYACCIHGEEHPWVKVFVWLCPHFPVNEPSELIVNGDFCYIVLKNEGARPVETIVQCEMRKGKLLYVTEIEVAKLTIDLDGPVGEGKEVFVDHFVKVRLTAVHRTTDVKSIEAETRLTDGTLGHHVRTRDLTLRFQPGGSQ